MPVPTFDRAVDNMISTDVFGAGQLSTEAPVFQQPKKSFASQAMGVVSKLLTPLTWTGTNIGDPLAGMVVGNLAKLQKDQSRYSKLGRISSDFEKMQSMQDGSFWDRWQNYGEFQRDREGVFALEKILTSTIADPLSYVGFGITGKLPGIAGKGLGLMEAQYIKYTNLPFQALGSAYKNLPKLARITTESRSQTVRREAASSIAKLRDYAVKASGKTSPTKSEITPAIFDVIEGKGTETVRRVVLRTRDKSVEEWEKLSVRFSGVEGLAEGTIHTLNEAFQNAVVGGTESRTSFLQLMSDALGVDASSVTKIRGKDIPVEDQMWEWLNSEVERVKGQVKNFWKSSNTYNEFEQTIAARNGSYALTQKNMKFDEWITRHGAFGSFVKTMDKAQTKYWQKGVNKYFVRPMSRAILTFPAFIGQELVESMERIALGRGVRTQGLKLKMFENPDRILSLLAPVDENVATILKRNDSITTRGLGESGTFKETFERFGIDISDFNLNLFSNPDNTIISRVGTYMNPNNWLKIANANSARAQANYLASRTMAHAAEAVDSVASTQTKVLFSTIDNIDKSFTSATGHTASSSALAELKDEFRMAVLSGEQSQVDQVVDRMIQGNLSQDRAKAIIDEIRPQFSDEYPRAIAILDDWAERGGDIEELLRLSTPQGGLSDFDEVILDGIGDSVAGVQAMNRFFDKYLDGVVTKTLTKADADAVFAAGYRQVDNFADQISSMVQSYTVLGRSKKLTRARKQALNEKLNKKLDDNINAMKIEFAKWRKKLEGVETLHTQGTINRTEELTEYANALFETWQKDRSEVAALFRNRSTYDSDAEFFDELNTLRQGIWDKYNKTKNEIKGKFSSTPFETTRREFSITPIKFKDTNGFKNGRITNANNAINYVAKKLFLLPSKNDLVRTIFEGAFRTPEEFADYGKRIASTFGHEIERDALMDIYKSVFRNYPMLNTSRFAQERDRLYQTISKITNSKSVNRKFTPDAEEQLRNIAEQIKSQMDPDELRNILLDAGKKASDDHKLAFVNYRDENIFDDFMKSVFPFWTYQSRRLPYLARTSVTNPVVWNNFVKPDARYFAETDNGYVSPTWMPKGLDINPFMGTMFNSPRRFYQEVYDNEGGVDSITSNLERFGFYPGSHTNMLLHTFKQPTIGSLLGEQAPPPMTLGLSAIASLGIPGLSDSANKMRTAVFPDKFRNYLIAKVAWESGINPADIDFKTYTPTKSALEQGRLSQEDLDAAIRLSARYELASESLGILRYRGDAEQQYRDNKDKIYREWTGLSQKELISARRQGIRFHDQIAMPPEVRDALNALDGADEYFATIATLNDDDKSAKLSTYYNAVEEQRQSYYEEQLADDDLLLNGIIDPKTWRNNKKNRAQNKANISYVLTGKREVMVNGVPIVQVVNADAPFMDVPIFESEKQQAIIEAGRPIPLRSEMDELISTYYSIKPEDKNGDGVEEWSDYYRNRDAFVDNIVPPQMKQEFFDRIDRNLSPTEKILRNLNRGVLGEYWNIEEKMQERYKTTSLITALETAQRFNDREEIDRIKASARYKAYKRAVDFEKDRMRLRNKELDYALVIFGYVSSFKNREAERFYNNLSEITIEGVTRKKPSFEWFDF